MRRRAARGRAAGLGRWPAVSILLLLAAAPAAIPALSSAAERTASGQDEEEESELDRFLRLARTGSAVVRPQAAQRLVGLGQPAAERLLAECGESPEEMAALGSELTEVLADFDDAHLRAKLWEALADPDFPWRPAAARGLMKRPIVQESERLLPLLRDPIALVREPAVMGVARLQNPDAAPEVRPLLADPDDRVRRAAARVLFRWGEQCTVAWIVEDLKREDRYFELETGKLARYKAVEALGGLTGHIRRRFGFQPEKTWDDPANAAAVEKIEAFCKNLCAELPELPPVARAAKATEGDVLGLEIRSCRKGEHYLRWSLDDVLYVGTGNAVRVELPEGTVARLMEAAGGRFDSLGREQLWGQPGCDLEQYHWRPDPGTRSRGFRVSKGQKAVEGLRPAALGELAELLLATLPEDGDDARTENLRARVREALVAVGGSLTSE